MKIARLFRNGQSQAVRLPKEYRFTGEKVLIKKVGNALILLPQKGSWTPLLESLNRFSDDFMETRQQPGQRSRERLFE
jgi:antitoxin VapB